MCRPSSMLQQMSFNDMKMKPAFTGDNAKVHAQAHTEQELIKAAWDLNSTEAEVVRLGKIFLQAQKNRAWGLHQ